MGLPLLQSMSLNPEIEVATFDDFVSDELQMRQQPILALTTRYRLESQARPLLSSRLWKVLRQTLRVQLRKLL